MLSGLALSGVLKALGSSPVLGREQSDEVTVKLLPKMY